MGTRAMASAFIASVGALAGLAVAGALATLTLPSPGDAILAVIFAVLVLLAIARPVHFAFRANIDLTTLLIIAIALTFDPSLAVLVTAAGALGGQLVQFSNWSGVVFNSSQVTIQAAVAVAILALFGWDPARPAYEDARYVPVFVLVMIAIFLVNTVLVSLVIGLQTRLSALAIWRDAVTADLLVEQASQFALGLAAALVVEVQPWIMPILLAPGLMLYIAANRKSRLEFQTRDAIAALADLVDRRDPYTADHSRRVAVVARELAAHMDLSPQEIVAIERAARVHDLGKLVIDLSLLNKEGTLTQEDWNLFRRHPEDGANILTWFPEFRPSAELVRYHHERWAGGGYPYGLSGEQIPLGARILAVADSLDAMSSARPYRPALTREVIVAEFKRHSGTQWDPAVVDALLDLIERGTIDLSTDGETPRVYDGMGTVVQGR
ncbi:MAG TPA: HD-GYP domain-containing protein [Thermomicrobiales bacterium]|nr:HD-GYP domain-containing protein [Thermomicrobiales bacterium]